MASGCEFVPKKECLTLPKYSWTEKSILVRRFKFVSEFAAHFEGGIEELQRRTCVNTADLQCGGGHCRIEFVEQIYLIVLQYTYLPTDLLLALDLRLRLDFSSSESASSESSAEFSPVS